MTSQQTTRCTDLAPLQPSSSSYLVTRCTDLARNRASARGDVGRGGGGGSVGSLSTFPVRPHTIKVRHFEGILREIIRPWTIRPFLYSRDQRCHDETFQTPSGGPLSDSVLNRSCRRIRRAEGGSPHGLPHRGGPTSSRSSPRCGNRAVENRGRRPRSNRRVADFYMDGGEGVQY
jgi:hypothetical protein